MTNPTFAVAVQWDGGGWTDETARVRHIHARSGFAQPHARIPAVGRCEIVLDNADRRFTPGNASSPLAGNLLPRKEVKVTASDGTTTWTLWHGFIEAIEPGAGDWNGKECVLRAVDGVALLEQARVSVEHASSQTPFNALYPLVSGAGVADTDIHTGDDALTDVGKDWLPENTRVLDAVRQVCDATYGRFWVARDGTATYWTRGDQQDPTASDALTVGADYRARLLNVQPASLIGYWRLNESSGTTAADSSDEGHDGTATGVTWGADGMGDGATAASFDGVNDYITLPHAALDAAMDFSSGTFMAWVNTDWVDDLIRTVFRVESSGDGQLFLNVSATGLVVFRHNTTGNRAQPTYTPSGTGWRHLAATWDATTEQAVLYLDGSAVSSGAGVASWTDALTDAHLGVNAGTSHFWNGDLAHCALWNTALSAAEIAPLGVA